MFVFIYLNDSCSFCYCSMCQKSHEKMCGMKSKYGTRNKTFLRALADNVIDVLSLHKKLRGCRRNAVTFISIGLQRNSRKSSDNFLRFRVIVRSFSLGLPYDNARREIVFEDNPFFSNGFTMSWPSILSFVPRHSHPYRSLNICDSDRIFIKCRIIDLPSYIYETIKLLFLTEMQKGNYRNGCSNVWAC